MSTLSRYLFDKLFSGQPQFLHPSHRANHDWVVGQPGTGKSWAFASWVMQDVQAGRAGGGDVVLLLV